MQKISEVYDKLYHYSTMDGLIGILQTQSLWATHYKFLNDFSEITLFRDKLISLMYPHIRESVEEIIKQSPQIKQNIDKIGGLEHVIQHEAQVLIDAEYSALGDEIYILSFCGQNTNPNINENGLLSQWRAYGSGGGVALVFDTKKLEEILDIESKRFEYSAMHISDLIYSNDENKLKEEFSEDLSIISDIVKQFFTLSNVKEQKEVDASKGYIPFVSCISRYKHYGFSEENEVRVVALPTVIDQALLDLAKADGKALKPEKERKFRNKNGQFIPYIELFNSSDSELPIERIIVGPHKEKEARATALGVMLRNTKIEISCSDIPFVG